MFRERACAAWTDECERKWGSSVVLSQSKPNEDGVQIREKLLTVLPGCGIEMERHPHYDEIWLPNMDIAYVVEKEAGRYERGLTPAFVAFWVPRGRKHLFKSVADEPATIYEVQIGAFGSQDKEVFPGHA